ncbi:Inner membrane metabolite transport protein YgcS [Aquisphaera giovannonii]|uniref:Inner membrane metabolite transport protein YgcS n=2 Tax=Aquisphaera giovannonii TaxID=406548 RepID=A0A5B9WBC0_9BACT|nr:Inner membrane metabolite transport protein YgcS [Aquisphaera giovannonii]
MEFRTDVPARMDRLPWSRWHWLVVAALGITWIIDGLEVTLIGTVSTVLQEPESLHFSGQEIGLLGTAYLAGAVLGALVFGYLTDRLGRKKLFTVTLGLYLVAAFCTAISWNFASFAFFRFLTGAAIGGEYSAINSAIDELIPARVRGWADLAINGTFWVGAAAGSLASVILLNKRFLPADVGWRVGFGLGAALGVIIILLRKYVPESPRWLLTHGHPEEAERIVADLEKRIEGERKEPLPAQTGGSITIRHRDPIGFGELASVMLKMYPGRTVLGLALIISQAFLYNGVFFTFPLILKKFYEVPVDHTGLYLLPFALTNFLGPLTLGRFFDTVGRKPMIAGTYTISAVLLAGTGYLFAAGSFGPAAQTLLWAIIFFFASSAASSAYLTVSEIFPVELRGMVIALFFAAGTLLGGTLAPWLFGRLVDSGSRDMLFYGDLFAAALLMATVGVVLVFGVKAEGASLEDIATPLSAALDSEAAEHGSTAPGGKSLAG